VTLKRSVERQGSLERIQVGGMRDFRKKRQRSGSANTSHWSEGIMKNNGLA